MFDTTQINLADPAFLASDKATEVFRDLRNNDPLPYCENDGTPFWAVLKHADIITVSSHPEVFSSEVSGCFLNDDTMAIEGAILTLDPPKHRSLRRMVSPVFSGESVKDMTQWLRVRSHDIMTRAKQLLNVDFIADMAVDLPLLTIGEIMGLSQPEQARLLDLMHRMGEVGALNTPEAIAIFVEMREFGLEIAQNRRQNPSEDLVSRMLNIRNEGEPLSDMEFSGMFLQIAGAATDTTRGMLAAVIEIFAQRPEVLAKVQQDPSLLRGTINETLRWNPAVHYMRRTATQDFELRGKQIKAGDRVMMFYKSANFDEEVFDKPYQFDIERQPNPHLSFGVGEHMCLGMRLAQTEMQVFLEEFIANFKSVELAGEVVRQQTMEACFYREMPVKLVAA